MQYIPSTRDEKAFNCPLCGIYAEQEWKPADYVGHTRALGGVGEYNLRGLSFAFCTYCKKYTLWFENKMIFPLINGAPLPHPDLPDDIKEIYEEARSVVSLSPKSAAAQLELDNPITKG